MRAREHIAVASQRAFWEAYRLALALAAVRRVRG
jgi:hypothetical protein